MSGTLLGAKEIAVKQTDKEPAVTEHSSDRREPKQMDKSVHKAR